MGPSSSSSAEDSKNADRNIELEHLIILNGSSSKLQQTNTSIPVKMVRVTSGRKMLCDVSFKMSIDDSIDSLDNTLKENKQKDIDSKIIRKVGLINVKNNCYANCILNILKETNCFRFSVYVTSCDNTPTYSMLRSLFISMMLPNVEAVSPLLVLLQTKPKTFIIGNQEDCFEYLVNLIELLDLEEMQAQRLAGINTEDPPTSIKELFLGKSKIVSLCQDCGFKKYNDDQYFQLILSFPNDTKNHSIESLLRYYFQPEIMSGDNKSLCDQCNNFCNATRTTEIVLAPPILIINLKIFQYSNRNKQFNKLTQKIDLTQHIKLENNNYELYAIVVHEGCSMNSGHYYSFVYNNATWLKFNDDLISETTLEEINNFGKRRSAYVLFYRKEGIPNTTRLDDYCSLTFFNEKLLKVRSEMKKPESIKGGLNDKGSAEDFQSAVAFQTSELVHSVNDINDSNENEEPIDMAQVPTEVHRKGLKRLLRSPRLLRIPRKRDCIACLHKHPVSAIQRPLQTPPQPSGATPAEKQDAKMYLQYGLHEWKKWVAEKNTEIERCSHGTKLFKTDILQLTPDEINDSLCLFVKEVHKPNGQKYAPDTIYYLCLGIQQYLLSNLRIDNIFYDRCYERFTDCFDSIIRNYAVTFGDSYHINARVEEEHLWETKQLGVDSAHVLLSTLMFFNIKHFYLETVQKHMQLSFSHIVMYWKHISGCKLRGPHKALLRFYPPRATSKDLRNSKEKVYEQQENEANPIRCPVKLYQFYLSKCPESVKRRNDIFYLLPEKSYVPEDPVWYSKLPLPQYELQKMVHRLKMVKEVNVSLLSI